MYTEEDLNHAIEQDIFSQPAVDKFRQSIASNKHTSQVDEENFKLIGSFNDIFVVITCLLLLASSAWVLDAMQSGAGQVAFPIIAWGLGEFFVRKRKMALPAIVLLIAFIGSVFALCMYILLRLDGVNMNTITLEAQVINISIAALLSTLAAYAHWLRFKVPITVAVGTVSLIAFLVTLGVLAFPAAQEYLSLILLFCGVGAFILAMFWDYADINRITYKSDVAFWLHLVSAPLIIHSVFQMLGVLNGDQSITTLASVVGLYVVMTLLSIIIDRRAFMVSALGYVLYAISTMLQTYDIGNSFAVTGILLSTLLLFLSVYWHQTRDALLSLLPASIRRYLAAA